MTKLIDEAKAYEPKQIKNIADLPSVSVDMEVKADSEAEFPYKYLEIDNERYKVPMSVIASLKVILGENPNLKTFKVKKTGQGLGTEYTTIPLA